MPPNNPNTPPPNYNFITQGDSKPKRKLSLPLPKLPKPLGAILLGILTIFVFIILYSLLFSGGSKTTGLTDIAAQAQEISRVSGLTADATTDQSLKTSTSTVQTIMDSNIAQIQDYLVKNKSKKISEKTLIAYKKSSTDTDIQSAVNSATLPDFYTNFLKTSLATFESSIKSVYDSAPASEKALLNDFYISSQTFGANL